MIQESRKWRNLTHCPEQQGSSRGSSRADPETPCPSALWTEVYCHWRWTEK